MLPVLHSFSCLVPLSAFCHTFLFSSLLPCLVGAHHVLEPAASMGDGVVPLALRTYRRKRGMSHGKMRQREKKAGGDEKREIERHI